MKKFFVKIMCAMSFICTTNLYAMEESEFSSLELRNGSKFPVKVTVYYRIQGVKDECQSSHDPVSIDLAPSTDGIQDQKKIPNPKRFGLVTVEVDGGIKFHNVVDLISNIAVGSNGTVFHSYNPCGSLNANVAPEWLFKSVTCKKFDLRGHAYTLSTKWGNLTEEQKKSPFASINDFPSCLCSIDTTPTMITPFPFCLKPEMKNAILAKYRENHPELNVSRDEILKLEAELKEKGLPFIH